MSYMDRYGNKISVGDPVCFTSSGWLEKGYVYKIVSNKVYMTCQPRDKRPVPDGHKVCDIRVLEKVNAIDQHSVAGYKSNFIIKL